VLLAWSAGTGFGVALRGVQISRWRTASAPAKPLHGGDAGIKNATYRGAHVGPNRTKQMVPKTFRPDHFCVCGSRCMRWRSLRGVFIGSNQEDLA
jgi:hypothetical protein